MKAHVLSLLLLASATDAAASKVHEAVRHPAYYTRGTQVAADTPLEFSFALKHSPASREWLRATVAAVSDPDSARYGKYVGLNELRQRMAVPQSQVAAVTDTLMAAGFTDIRVHPGGDFVKARAPAVVAARYFETDFCEFTHDKAAGQPITRACESEYRLPAAVSAAVDFVSGLVHFPRGPTLEVSDADVRAATNTLDQLRKTYKLQGVKPTGAETVVAFTQFIGEKFSPAALETFLEKFSPDQAGQPVTKQVGDQGTGNGGEANLDAQYLLGTAGGVETWAWDNQNVNAVNNQEPWMEFFQDVLNNASVPDVISISYGEGDTTLTPDYITRSDTELQKIAARGITVLVSSGDSGAGCMASGKAFAPEFPASLPSILSIGATQACTEGAGTAGFSGGGFSEIFPQTEWQREAVQAYLARDDLPPASYFNASGRAYPDVAACGYVYVADQSGRFSRVAGTSCSCPIFAGVVGLLNDARLAAGKPTLGMIAPALYKAYGRDASVFDDVASGSTQGCGFLGRGARFSAVAGWDPTTGLGTPNFEKLSKALLAF